jgi:hypothetical protein
MLDRWFESPMVPLGFIVFVVFLAMIYFVNRERAQVRRLKGPRRFRPEWGRRHDGLRSRRPRARSGGEFKPAWTKREASEEAPRSEEDSHPNPEEESSRDS